MVTSTAIVTVLHTHTTAAVIKVTGSVVTSTAMVAVVT